ncbi:MAG: polysaccharide deacetylase family protein [Marinilabiliales bacterium]|nr:MAG: polysaccharide deacetylase family protein [Marinilabiliales bacterium]
MPSNENKIYLTFDDGPHPDITFSVVKLLEKYNAKATFFCVGENVQKYPDTFEFVKNQGHSVGNHSFNHLNGWKTDNDDYYLNIEKADEIISSKLFRPPYGRISPGQIKHLKNDYKIIMWSALSYDFDARVSKEECLNFSIKNSRPGSIIVFHDSEKSKEKMFYSCEGFLDYFSQKGVEFASLNENLFFKDVK